MALDGHIPGSPLEQKWDKHQFELKLVNPANKRKHDIIVVGTGLAGAAAAASLAELGYHVLSFCIQDSPRRAHSIALAQAVPTKLPGSNPLRLLLTYPPSGAPPKHAPLGVWIFC